MKKYRLLLTLTLYTVCVFLFSCKREGKNATNATNIDIDTICGLELERTDSESLPFDTILISEDDIIDSCRIIYYEPRFSTLKHWTYIYYLNREKSKSSLVADYSYVPSEIPPDKVSPIGADYSNRVMDILDSIYTYKTKRIIQERYRSSRRGGMTVCEPNHSFSISYWRKGKLFKDHLYVSGYDDCDSVTYSPSFYRLCDELTDIVFELYKGSLKDDDTDREEPHNPSPLKPRL